MDILEFIWHFLLEAFVLSFGAICLWRWFQNSQYEPRELLAKLGITALVALLFVGAALLLGGREYTRGEGSGVFALLPFAAVFCGIILSLVWTPVLGGWLAKSFTGAIDGGDEPPDPQPFYSVAKALAARGKIPESIAEIQRQRELFPDDFEGLMLLAETQALSLHDPGAAETTVQDWCKQSGRPARQVCAALTALADWHLKAGRDQLAAKKCLEQISGLFPDSEFSTAAAQRLAHLGDGRMILPATERNKFAVTEGIQSLGLRRDEGLVRGREVSPEEQAEALVKQLEEHPLDTEAREQLAEIYAHHYERVDLATDQLEQLVAMPDQPARNTVRWLNALADLQIRVAGDYEAAKKSLQRIVDLAPDLAAGQLARSRMELLRLELKGKGKSQAVKLGSYEQNIGLKRGLPR